MINIRYSIDHWNHRIDAIQVVADRFPRQQEFPYRYLVRCLGERIVWRIINEAMPGGKTNIHILFKDQKTHQSNLFLTPESFLEKVREYSKEDFFFLLWHPEIFRGNFFPTNQEWNGHVKYPKDSISL